MAVVKPFRALRYNPDVVGRENIKNVVCPPYDVIGPEAQQSYLHESQYNVVRLELGEVLPSDSATNNRYTRAATTLRVWQDIKVLITDAEPAFYLYEQEFKQFDQTYRRRAMLAIVQLEEPTSGVIVPHEATISRYKQDRLALLQATRTNLSPIFCLYNDPNHQVENAYALAFARKENLPLYDFVDDLGETHRVWQIKDARTISALERAFANKRLYIADGHHRYETALAYRDQLKAEAKLKDGDNYILAGLTALEDSGLMTLPLHRLVGELSVAQLEQLDKSLPAYFGIEEIDIEGEENPAAFMAELIARMNQSEDGLSQHHVFGMYGQHKNTFTTLSLKSPEAAWELMPARSEAWQNLDVSIFQTVILEGCLGLSPESLAAGDYVTYTREPAEAISKIQSGEAQRAFILPATPVADMVAVADSHDQMPPKSTFFYPKFTTGLVMRNL